MSAPRCRASRPCPYCIATRGATPEQMLDLSTGRAIASVRKWEGYSNAEAAWLGWMAMESLQDSDYRALVGYLEEHHGR